MRPLVIALFLFASITSSITAQDGAQPFTTEDALNVASLTVADITEDGRFVAATRWTQRDRKNVDHMRFGDPTYVSPSTGELVVIDVDGGSVTSVFGERVQIRSARWSPSGDVLAFFLLKDGEFVLHTYDRRRDRVREVQLKTRKSIASNSALEWRPDGASVILSLRADGWAAQSRQMYLDLSVGPTIVQDSRDPFLAWDAVRNRGSLSIPALVNLDSRDVVELLPEDRYDDLTQSEDGRFVSFTRTNPLRTSYKRNGGTELEIIALDVESGEVRSLLDKTEDRVNPNWNDAGDAVAYAQEGDVFVRAIGDSVATNLTEDHRAPVSDDDSTKLRYSMTRWRPDGQAILVRSQRGFHTLDPSTKAIELVYELPEDEEEGPRIAVTEWSPDGRQLYMTYSARDRWERGLVRYDIQSRQTTDLVKDRSLYSRWRFSDDGERVFYDFSNGDLPNDLYVTDPAFRSPRRLTNLNPWLADRKLTRSELVEYMDVDGNTLYGVLYYPVDYEAGKPYPLVSEIYEQFFDNGFNHRMNLLANAGFFGFRPSAELETGFPGEGWLKGVTAGINKLIERGLVDPEKLGVHGTSYGGYATNLLITQTDRFAAAINISGKVNIISFLGDSPKITTRNYRAAEEGQDRIGATLWEQPQKYLAHSAILYADRIETPLLMLTGEGDWNVPATNQREMYYALRRLEKEVVWVHYMNAGHGAGRSSTVEDFHDHWNRIIDWYREHFEDEEEEKATTDATGSPEQDGDLR